MSPETECLVELLMGHSRRRILAELELCSGNFEKVAQRLLPQNRDKARSANKFSQRSGPLHYWAGAGRSPADRVVGYFDEQYPEALRAIPDPPLVLELRGNQDLVGAPSIAIVGARRCTRQGMETAERFASELGQAGLVINSGLALGVDGAAHRGALAAGAGTLACLGSGHAQIYPRAHWRLAERIVDSGGLLISEYAASVKPRPHQFPERNRLISGLSNGVLLVEAGERSGSLITARLALEQGREVFALPGPIASPLSRGCHGLIRQGAELVMDTGQILEGLGLEGLTEKSITKSKPPFSARKQVSQDHAYLLNFLFEQARTVDELLALTAWPQDRLMTELSLMELDGIVRRQSDGYIARS